MSFVLVRLFSLAYCLINLSVFRFDVKGNFAVFAGEFDALPVEGYGFDLA